MSSESRGRALVIGHKGGIGSAVFEDLKQDHYVEGIDRGTPDWGELTTAGKLSALVVACGGIRAQGLDRKDIWIRNYEAPVHYVKEWAPALERAKGSVVVITSMAAYLPTIDESEYSAAKAALVNWCKQKAIALAQFGVRLNMIAPGAIDTPMLRALAEKRGVLLEHFYREQKSPYVPHILLGRLGTPRDIASATRFLLSDGASYITGQTLHVNGGAYFG